MPIPSAIKKFAGLVMNGQVEEFYKNLQAGEAAEAISLLRQSNRSTRRAMMSRLCMSKLCEELTVNSSLGAPGILDQIGHTALELNVRGGWPSTFLHLALRAGNASLAMRLLCGEANPNKMPPEGGSDLVERLAYGDYSSIGLKETLELLGEIETRGGNFFKINPGGVANIEVLKFLVARWPSAQTATAWQSEGFVFDLKQSINQQSTKPDASEKIAFMVAAGFPFKPIDALATALSSGRYENARYLLSLISDDQLRGTYREDDEGRTLWHVVASTWATRRCRQLNMGFTDPEMWPPQEIIERLLVIEWQEKGDEKHTPGSLAIAMCGEEGPLAEIPSQQIAMRLQKNSIQISNSVSISRSRRL